MTIFGHVTGANSAVFGLENNVPTLYDKTILITGGDNGIGKQVVRYLAQLSPSQIWLAAKNSDNADAAIAEIQQQVPGVHIRIVQMNLASFASVKAAAAVLIAQIERLDILLLNAGVMGLPAQLTDDGYEYQFGINHLGHALLTKLLLPILIRTAESDRDVRVIVTSSYSHRNAPRGGIDFDILKTDGRNLPTLKRYAQSKLANILFARVLAERYPQITAAAIHPGASRTNLILRATGLSITDWMIGLFIYQPVEVVAKHHIWAIVTPSLQSGEYYEPLGLSGQGSPDVTNRDLALELWEWTERELGPHVI